MYSLSPDTIKYADALCCEKYGISELTLMKNAAKKCFSHVTSVSKHKNKIVIICGKGNNGGDGYELATLLHNALFDVKVINVFGCEPNTTTARAVYKRSLEHKVRMLPLDDWQTALYDADIIIDALFGVGFYGTIENDSEIGKMISFCNEKSAKRIAIDTPSGINSADGRVEGVAFMADITVTMAYVKTGMLSYPAKEYCGEIIVVDIGYPIALHEEIPKNAFIPDDEFVKATIPKRKQNTHKGTYGRLLMYCGSVNMTGAAILASTAALRSGVGLLNIARDEETVRILQSVLTEPIFSPVDDENEVLSLSQKASAVLIGCGMGRNEKDKNILFSLIKNAECNLIIDADGINELSSNTNILKEAKKTPILTPHPLEFARLLSCSVEEVQSDRINKAKAFAKEYGCILVLKGASTIIASPDGRLSVNLSGNPGLSRGGSGDVLAGLVSSFCAQGIEPFDSAVCACYLHGKAADVLKEEIGEYGMLPSDLPMAIAKLLP